MSTSVTSAPSSPFGRTEVSLFASDQTFKSTPMARSTEQPSVPGNRRQDKRNVGLAAQQVNNSNISTVSSRRGGSLDDGNGEGSTDRLVEIGIFGSLSTKHGRNDVLQKVSKNELRMAFRDNFAFAFSRKFENDKNSQLHARCLNEQTALHLPPHFTLST